MLADITLSAALLVVDTGIHAFGWTRTQSIDYIREHTKPGERVFVWGDWPALYVESDRLMASRFPGFLRGFERGSSIPPDNWDTKPDVWPALESDLIAHPPALIVDTAAAGWSG